MDGIQIQVERAEANSEISVIMINGYIDTTTSSELERVIQNLLREQRYKIIVDLSGVDYISSAGWGIFISEIKNLRSHRGDLKLANMSPNVSEVYELLEFATILTSAPSVPDAVKMFDGAAAEMGMPPVKKPLAGQPAVATAATAAPKAAVPPKPPTPTAINRPAVPPPAGKVRPTTANSAAKTSQEVPASSVKIPAPVPAPTPISAPSSAPVPVSTPAPAPVSTPAQESAPLTSKPTGLVPLIDRIHEVVKAHPDWGAWKMKGELNRSRGNQPKVSWGEVRAELKFSGLKTKEQRYNFSRSR
jgi:anti-anti-sigma factor